MQTKIELDQAKMDIIQLKSHNGLLEDEIDSLEVQLFQAKQFAWTFFILFWIAVGILITINFPNELHMVLSAIEDLMEHLFK